MSLADKIITNKYVLSFAEYTMNTRLFEMASERNSCLVTIKSYKRTINEHLFKYFLMPHRQQVQHIDRNHWKTELHNFFSIIDDLTWNKNKKFKPNEYYEILFDYYFEYDNEKKARMIFKDIEEQYADNHQISYSYEAYKERCSKFMVIISSEISNNNYSKKVLEENLNKILC